MKTMKLFEPAMCCSTGLCGVSVDPELLRISTVLDTLKKNDITVERYNLNSTPMEFVSDKTINDFVSMHGVQGLPATMLDREIVLSGRYPTNAEITAWLELPADLLNKKKQEGNCCCCKGGC